MENNQNAWVHTELIEMGDWQYHLIIPFSGIFSKRLSEFSPFFVNMLHIKDTIYKFVEGFKKRYLIYNDENGNELNFFDENDNTDDNILKMFSKINEQEVEDEYRDTPNHVAFYILMMEQNYRTYLRKNKKIENE